MSLEHEDIRVVLNGCIRPANHGREKRMRNRDKDTFNGCTIVVTGKLENFTRAGINDRITSLGAVAGSSVTRKTDYLICGDRPGSKLTKARELGVTILTEQEFLDMIPA